MSKPWQVWLVLAGIYVFGGVCGVVAGYQWAWEGRRHPLPPPREWVMRRVALIGRELKLTTEQKARIQPIVQRNLEELNKAWRQSIVGSRAIVERMEREIAAELTPEQRARMDQFLKERREHFRKMLRERALRGDRDLPPDVEPEGRPPPRPPEDVTGSAGT